MVAKTTKPKKAKRTPARRVELLERYYEDSRELTEIRKRKEQDAKTKREALKQSVQDWLTAAANTLEFLRRIAIDMQQELANPDSQLHEFINHPSDLESFVINIEDADCALTNLLVRDPISISNGLSIPNPTHLLNK